MPLQLFYSHSIHNLFQIFDSQYKVNSLFSPPQVVVGGNMGEWLKLQLTRSRGVIANFQVVRLERTLWKILEDADHEHEPVEQINNKILARLIFNEIDLLEKRTQDNTFHDLLKYIGSLSQDHTSYYKKKLQIAEQLSSLFMEYELKRVMSFAPSDLVHNWVNGEDCFQKSFYRDHERAKELEAWQKELYFRIFSDQGSLARLKQETGINYKTIAHYFNHVFSQKNQVTLNHELHIFNMSQISLLHRTIVQWASEVLGCRIYVYVFNPCIEFWEDINQESAYEFDDDEELNVQNDLLKTWGRPGKESIRLWNEGVDYNFHQDSYMDSIHMRDTKILPYLQRSIIQSLNSPLRGCALNDASFQISSHDDETDEVVYVLSQIQQLAQEEKEFKYEDVGIYVTDMIKYGPIITGLCSEQDPKRQDFIPVKVQTASFKSPSLKKNLSSLLQLITGDFSRKDFFAYFQNDSLLHKKGFDPAEVEHFEQWVDKLNIFYGMSHDKHPNPNAWNYGLNKILDSYWLLEETGEFVLYKDINTQDRQLVGKFVSFVYDLYEDLQFFKRSRTLEEWGELLSVFLKQWFFGWDDLENLCPEDKLFLTSFLGRLDTFPLFSVDSQLSYEFIVEVLTQELHTAYPFPTASIVGGVNVQELIPHPPQAFKYVFILGLGDRYFPLKESPSTLDLKKYAKRLIGDNSSTDTSKYLLLEILMSCSQKLELSFVGKDVRKDEELQPSPVILELLEYLGKYTDAPIESLIQFKQTQPIRTPFIKEEFVKFAVTISETEVKKEWKLSELKVFLKNPLFYLHRSLHSKKERLIEDTTLKDLESFSLQTLDSFTFKEGLLAQLFFKWYEGESLSRNTIEQILYEKLKQLELHGKFVGGHFTDLEKDKLLDFALLFVDKFEKSSLSHAGVMGNFLFGDANDHLVHDAFLGQRIKIKGNLRGIDIGKTLIHGVIKNVILDHSQKKLVLVRFIQSEEELRLDHFLEYAILNKLELPLDWNEYTTDLLVFTSKKGTEPLDIRFAHSGDAFWSAFQFLEKEYPSRNIPGEILFDVLIQSKTSIKKYKSFYECLGVVDSMSIAQSWVVSYMKNYPQEYEKLKTTVEEKWKSYLENDYVNSFYKLESFETIAEDFLAFFVYLYAPFLKWKVEHAV